MCAIVAIVRIERTTVFFHELRFYGASNFNGDISGLKDSSFKKMNNMFFNTTSFDQDLGLWNISNVSTMKEMFEGVKLSIENYDNILIGWTNQSPYIKNDVFFHAGYSTHTTDPEILVAIDILVEFTQLG
ncbi:MAG: BspA family leucine-rich repeat surface protein [Candidatus Lokiarchaeota archaeon]|nr:BspA family leucine-rich repeat surface protein [Candidatus Lokiarchaeota archaeon]